MRRTTTLGDTVKNNLTQISQISRKLFKDNTNNKNNKNNKNNFYFPQITLILADYLSNRNYKKLFRNFIRNSSFADDTKEIG